MKTFSGLTPFYVPVFMRVGCGVDRTWGGRSEAESGPSSAANSAGVLYPIPLRPFLPALREVAKELEKYPNVELVDVLDARDHVRVAMVDGKLRIDAVSGDGDVVHVSVPARVLRDMADELEEKAPGV